MTTQTLPMTVEEERKLDRECTCNHFGNCPECKEEYGANGSSYVNVGRDHWGYCNVHKTKWRIGENLFSSWREETDEDRQKNRALLSAATEVKPWHCDVCVAQMEQCQTTKHPSDERVG